MRWVNGALARSDRASSLFDACVARLDAAIRHAEDADFEIRWLDHRAAILPLWRRAARLPPDTTVGPSGYVLAGLSGGAPLLGWHISLSAAVLDRADAGVPEALLALARAIEMAVADCRMLRPGQSALIAYVEQNGRIVSTGGSHTGTIARHWWAAWAEAFVPPRLTAILVTAAAAGSVAGCHIRAG